MAEHIVRMDGEIRCKTEWLPAAEAAWDRASRDRNAAQHGGTAELEVNGEVVARAQPRTRVGHPWPVPEDDPSDLNDVAAAVLQLCRVAGVPPGELADAMGESGLPTTRSRLKSISTIEPGRRSSVSPAEVIVMCYAAIGRLKNEI